MTRDTHVPSKPDTGLPNYCERVHTKDSGEQAALMHIMILLEIVRYAAEVPIIIRVEIVVGIARAFFLTS